MVVRQVRIVPLEGEGLGELVDLRIVGGVITEVGSHVQPCGELIVDAEGRWVIPGLWDAHVHCQTNARTSTWFDLSATSSSAEVLDVVSGVIRDREPDERCVVGFGYRSGLWPHPASVAELDLVTGDQPVVLIAGDAHNGWLNSAAARTMGVGPFTGAVFEEAWFEIFDRLTQMPGFEPDDAAFGQMMRTASARGITGVVDVELSDAFIDWPARVARGLDGWRVRCGVYEAQLDEVIACGLTTGDALDASGLVTMGPLKIISDGSLSSATAWCFDVYADNVPGWKGGPNLPTDRLSMLVNTAARHGLDVAIHGIGDRACATALDVIDMAGARGSLEHAQLMRPDDIVRCATLGVTASVQPCQLPDDRDTIERCWPGRSQDAYAFRSMLNAGVRLALGSDAPICPIDPWSAIAVAVHRSGDGRPAWHPEQSLTPREAIAASVDGNRIAMGNPGDLVILDADPLWQGQTPAETAAHLAVMPVHTTICAGRVTFAAANPPSSADAARYANPSEGTPTA